MINNIFEYGDKEAKDIMVNRNNMVGIESTMTLQEAASFIVDAHNSRFPVYDGRDPAFEGCYANADEWPDEDQTHRQDQGAAP